MSKTNKKRFNWKGRQVVTTIIDNSNTKNINVDLAEDKTKFDDCNALVLPAKKRKTKIKQETQQITRILSKKQRKRLEKIVEKKKKKDNRATLLEALSKVQATPEELSQLTSIASVQTKGLKKYFQEQNAPENPLKRKHAQIESDLKINSVRGSKHKRLSLIQTNDEYKNDPNVVGFDSSTDEESEEEDNLDEDENEPKIEEKEVLNNAIKTENRSDSAPNIIETTENRSDSASNNVEETENNIKSESVEVIQKETTNEVKKIIEDSSNVVAAEDRKPSTFVPVIRSEAIEKARLKLPILSEEQQIMETINENSIILIAGETGSGKTTQVPQFLYEAGYALDKTIAVTEPRRVAAIAMSNRVGVEMNLPNAVSYLIRFEGNVTDNTKIKFMTDGVLLKEIQTDFLLTKYSVVILDEAHERSVYTDILIGLLSRIVPLRIKKGMPLKLIIMSATLRLDDFTENARLFRTTPPVLKVEGRQFPVTVHFNKRTPDDYIKEAYHKVVKIHTKLPDGAILVFVTGQQEVVRLVHRLRKAFPLKQTKQNPTKNTRTRPLKRKQKKLQTLPAIDLDDYGMPGDIDDALDISCDELSDTDSELDELGTVNFGQPLWTLPLYSLLPSYKQAKVFEAPPEGCRMCVIATNVAETSLTIPNVKYVIDTGKAKVKLYDKVTGVSSYQVMWTSKASANQRAGRAGRTGAGHCYRLYSSAVFNDIFPEYSTPEIREKPVDDLYLQMKCMNIDKVVNFPFPTAPDLLQLKTAEKRLEILGALKDGKVTPLGKAISRFPVLPRFGKMLALSHQYDLLPYTICMVAALSVQEVLLETPVGVSNIDDAKAQRNKWQMLRRQWAGVGNSQLLGDPMVLLRAVGAAEFANANEKLEEFCKTNGLRQKAVVEIRKLRIQLTNEIRLNVKDCDVVVNPKLEPPNEIQTRLLRQVLLSGMGDQIAKRIYPHELKENEDKTKFKYAYRCMDMEDPVFLHSSSVLRKSQPDYVIYQEIYETNKMYMRGITAIEPEWLPTYVPSLCNLSEPLLAPEPHYDPSNDKIYCSVNGSFGRQGWILPTIEIEFPKNVEVFKWFARFLLEGKVYPKLLKYTSSLISTPSTMVKTWAKLQSRTEAMLKALIAKDVWKRQNLEDIWKIHPQFLLHEYQKWLPESAHNDVTLIWPPL